MYRVVVVQKDGTQIGEIINFVSLKFEKRLNNFGTCTIRVPLVEPLLIGLIALRRYEVQIYRDTTLVWAGEQAHVTGSLDGREELITITCFSYLEMFNQRYTDAIDEYLGVDAGEIAWQLIDDSQNLTDGDLGITEGTIQTTQNRDRTYYNQNIMEAIINLSNVIGGFDFEISDTKVFNIYEKKGTDRSSTVVFEYGNNMAAGTIESDFTTPINEAIVLGEGFGATQLRTTSVDVASRSAHQLRQGRYIDTEVSEEATLDEKGEEIIRKHKQPILNVTFKQVETTQPAFGTIELGDYVRVIIDKGIWDIDNTFRVYGMVVDIASNGAETVEYLVSLYI